MLNVLSLPFLVGDISCRLVTIHPDNHSDPQKRHFQHSHSGCELHYVSAGELSMDCIGASYPLSAGQVLLIPPGLYHYVRNVSEDIDRMDLLLEIKQGQQSKDPQLDALVQALFLKRPLLLVQAENPELFVLLERIRQTARNVQMEQTVQREWLKALCQELVLLTGAAAKACGREETGADLLRADTSTDRYIMDQFFNHNYHGSKDMAALAKELNLSVRQTGRVLQKTYGKGFREKLNECRLAVALDLLRNTDKTMAEIAEILGYGEPANFSSFIKSQTGRTPAKIRKEK